MRGPLFMKNEAQNEMRTILNANAEARAVLSEAAARLRAILEDEPIVEDTPIEATTAMEMALRDIDTTIAKLKAATTAGKRPTVIPGGPTPQQGQFLAFISEYMVRNYAGVAPTHADFQRFFSLTPLPPQPGREDLLREESEEVTAGK